MLTPESLDSIEPRPEARPLTWAEMTEEQREATKRVGKLVRDLGDLPFSPMVPQKGPERFLPPIDATRRNHVVLLDGGRGSGKTALLVTHIAVWSFGVRHEGARVGIDGAPDKELQEALAPLGRIVPVGLLDLQPLPQAANLLVYVATRFKRIVEAIEMSTGHDGARAPWHAAEPEGLKSATEWRSFLQAAAAGWDGSLEGRRARSDPETYAVELEQAEEQRLDVISSFRRFIDALVADYAHVGRLPRDKPPLFVMAIDDADMNVSRSSELLDIVRTLWHPRVVFLLTGDTNLFLAALQLRTERELTGTWQKVDASAERLVRALPRDIYDKVVPPLHRLELKALRVHERHSLLERWFEARTKPVEMERISRVRALFERYPGLKAALPGRLRPLQDFALWVGGIYNRGQSIEDGVVEARVLHYLWTSASHEAWPIPQFEAWVTEDDERRVVVRLDVANKFRFSTRMHPFGEPEKTRFEVAREWHLAVYGPGGALVPEALAACVVPLLDLGSNPENRHVISLVPPSIETSEFGAVLVRLGDELPWVPWPLPQWTRFLDYIAFADRWSRQLNDLMRAKTHNVAALALAYLDSVLGAEPHTGNEPWRSRAEQLSAILQDPNADAATKGWALLDAPLLATPESGLDVDDANAWINAVRALFTQERWDVLRAMLMERRRSRIRKAYAGTVSPSHDMLDENGTKLVERDLSIIKRRLPEYAWLTMVERDADVTFRALLNRMDQISVPGERSAGTLLSYLTPSRRQELRSAPVGTIERLKNVLEELAKQRGHTGLPAIERLWRVVTQDASAALKEAVSYLGKLELNSEKAFAESGHPVLQADSTECLLLDSSDAGKMMLRLSRGQLLWSLGKNVGLPILAVLRMVWDIESDTKGHDISPLRAWWPLGGGVLSQALNIPCPWPAPAWPTFLDWERLIDAWNDKVVPRVASLAQEAADTGSSTEVFGDSAAYWYVTTIDHMSLERCDLEHLEFRIESDPTEWRARVREWFRRRKSDQNTPFLHRRIFYEWLDRIGLLAAPESGLSGAVAENILAGIPDLDQRREQLARLRRDWIESMPPTLRRIMSANTADGAFPDHPWTVLIEEPLRPKTPPDASSGP
ncbi:hypothetical protein WMF26_06675 [Sorangium sp. So ce185]|uniref:hypothetical protein n=1 Tax=Sorangium sp. So ce185 TaxID=3133287 RepID=UPI003F62DA05